MNNKNRYLGDNRIKSIDDEFILWYFNIININIIIININHIYTFIYLYIQYFVCHIYTFIVSLLTTFVIVSLGPVLYSYFISLGPTVISPV